MNILIAHDEAFNFTYRANIDALRQLGEVTFFSPLRDTSLNFESLRTEINGQRPDFQRSTLLPSLGNFPLEGGREGNRLSQHLLYLPGGYPELFAEQLAANTQMRNSIKVFAQQGGQIYAECGGFMYLTHDIDGLPMCGVFPFKATMQDAHLHLGYRQMAINGITVYGHEFHYSDVILPRKMPDDILVEQNQYNARGTKVPTAIYRYKNVIAGYTHWYWADKVEVLKSTNLLT